jgi:hypothetical protein
MNAPRAAKDLINHRAASTEIFGFEGPLTGRLD